jgi:hypothetical protein
MNRYRVASFAWTFAALLAVGGCSSGGGDDGGGGNTGPSDVAVDGGSDAEVGLGSEDADETEDVATRETGPGDDDPDATSDATDDASPGSDGDTTGGDGDFLCTSCSEDADCGGPDDQCNRLPDGEQRCTSACDPEADAPCPEDYTCVLSSDSAEMGQCIPDRRTCVDRCSDVDCQEGNVCNPLTGQCIERKSQCESCRTDAVCGDGPEDRCVTLPNTGGETVCAQGCNPQTLQSTCPLDNFCVQSSETEDTEGVCIPVDGTCRDRCSNKTCPEGENCNRKTGQCEKAQYGACQKGCTSDAQCGDQDDRCLALGFVDEAHCWQSCDDPSESCPNNYECATLPNTTVSVCIPTARRCQQCDGSSCFPEKACDPQSGQCIERSQNCVQTGCSASDELCDPRSGDCVEVGRTCSGNSWAQDCDYTATGCTTQVPDTDGTCEKICTGSGQCGSGTQCVQTNLNRGYCLDDDRGGPETCGTLHPANRDVGAPCEDDGDCGSNAPTCVQGGNIRGFCSTSCQSDADCAGSQRCDRAGDGTNVCIPTQCECAADPSVGSGAKAGWNQLLSDLDTNQCELYIHPDDTSSRTALQQNPLASDALESQLRLPARAMADRRSVLNGWDGTRKEGGLVVEAAAAADLSVSASAGNPSFGGSNSPLTQAVVDLAKAAGGSPNASQIEQQAQSVPMDFQNKVAAPVVQAVADAYRAREQALSNAGWNQSRRQEAFESAPHFFLPGTSSQLNSAPDLSKSSIRNAYESFPLEAMADASADLAATIRKVRRRASNSNANWSGFSFVVDTPAGKVVLGDSGSTIYDPNQNSQFGGDVAVLVDAGGDDTYRIPAGANQSVSNGVAVTLDLGGDDRYAYETASDPRDTQHLLDSDADGRKPPKGVNQGNGAVSLSRTARQGAGRVGIGGLFDVGGGKDTYESLRMSQGAAVFGVGMLVDDGGRDTYRAEALAQGAALGGLALAWDGGGDDTREVWHAGQGFGTASGTGVLVDYQGNDTYRAVPGDKSQTPAGQRGNGVLYFSPPDRRGSNRNLAQGAGVGVDATSSSVGLGGGRGILRDRRGKDTYRAGTHAQGYGAVRGLGLLADARGKDTYEARILVQGTGRQFGGGILDDAGGSDQYNTSTSLRRSGQGFGELLGWGVFRDAGGSDTVRYGNPGGGVGIDGGFGIALFGGGKDTHELQSLSGWGLAQNGVSMGQPLGDALTVGLFVDAGSKSDTYTGPLGQRQSIGNGKSWTQPDPSTDATKGAGLDR